MAAIPLIAGQQNASSLGASANNYYYMGDAAGGPSTSEVLRQTYWGQAGVLSFLTVYISANDRGASTARTRKNTANGGQSVSIGSSATGVFQDTSGSDTLAQADLVNYHVATGAGGTNFTAASFACLFAATTDSAARYQRTRNSGFSNSGETNAIEGGFANTAADDNILVQTAGDFKYGAVKVATNSRNGTSTYDLLVNGSASAVTISITTSTTGTFTDLTHSASVVDTDTVRWLYTAGGTTGFMQLEWSSIDFVTTTGNSAMHAKGSPSAIASGNTRYSVVSGDISTGPNSITGATTEPGTKSASPSAFLINAYNIYIAQQTGVGTSTATLLKNSVASAAAISFSAAGSYTDSTPTTLVASGDFLSIELVTGAQISFRTFSIGTGPPDLSVNVFESIAITEAINNETGLILHENIAITESSTLILNPLLINASESITITEGKTVEFQINVNLHEDIAVTEALGSTITSTISASENISITEALTLVLSIPMSIDTSESITITESVSLQPDVLLINLSEEISISENFSTGESTKTAFERIYITEYVALGVSALTIHAAEEITITEGPLNHLGPGSVIGLSPAPTPVTVAGDYWVIGI